MDLAKTGKFIQEQRKAKKLTQAELAKQIAVSEKTISKWECGNGFPDSSLILPLCNALDITANELLSSKRISNEEYKSKAEKTIVELAKQNTHKDKLLLATECVVGGFSVAILLIATIIASYVNVSEIWRVLIVIGGLIFCLVGVGFAIVIEKDAGYYECKHCKHKHIPTFKQIICSMHAGRTRYIKCPKCHKHSWQKKKVDEN